MDISETGCGVGRAAGRGIAGRFRAVTVAASCIAAMAAMSAVAVQAMPIPVAMNVTPAKLGSGWQQTTNGGFFPTYTLEAAPGIVHKLAIRFDTGQTARFGFGVTPSSQVLFPFGINTPLTPVFTALSGPATALTDREQPYLFFHGGNGPGSLLDLGPFDVYDPYRFRLTFASGESVDFDRRQLPTFIAEPATLGLLGLGLGGLGLAARRRRRG